MKYLLPLILVVTLAACDNKVTYSGKTLPPADQSTQQTVQAVEATTQPVEDFGKRMLAAVSNSWTYADIVCWDAKNRHLFVHFSNKEAEEHRGWWLVNPPYDKVFLTVGNGTLSMKSLEVRTTSLGNVTTTGLECLDDGTRR